MHTLNGNQHRTYRDTYSGRTWAIDWDGYRAGENGPSIRAVDADDPTVETRLSLPLSQHENLRPIKELTIVDLGAHGRFVAHTFDVVAKMKRSTKRQMVRECCELWPELLRDGSWSRTELATFPAYVLAVILSQV